MDVLRALKRAIAQGQNIETIDEQEHSVSIENARFLRLPGGTWPVETRTGFESQLPEPELLDLRSVLNCWLTRDLSVPEYIAISDERGIKNLKFLERADLLAWLDGSSETSEYIREDQDSETAAVKVNYKERTLQNHITVMHGSKPVDFSGVAKLAHKHVLIRKTASTKAPSQGGPQAGGSAPLKPGRDPIILLSPSPSSLLNMNNAKSFLEEGKYEPILRQSTAPNLQRIVRHSKLLGDVKFVVVDSVAQFKPEYWDRVVAVFVTGQTWQLKQYKWRDANSLFAHVLGFALVYKNDPVPDTLRQWNVRIEPLERTQRFRDREVVERIWERIEETMVARGWPVQV